MCKDVKCPICGSLQKNLYLNETGGWFECSNCGSTVAYPEDMPVVKVPLLKAEPIKKAISA